MQQSFETLYTEQGLLRAKQEDLKREISIRSTAFRQEEMCSKRLLDKELIKSLMLGFERECLEALLNGDQLWVIEHQARYIIDVRQAKSAAIERRGQNAWMNQEMQRLAGEIQSLEGLNEHSHAFGLVGVSERDIQTAIAHNDVLIEAAKKNVKAFPQHSKKVLRHLDQNAQASRERFTRQIDDTARTCAELLGCVVGLRNRLREMHSPAVANELVVWAEASGRAARNKATWDLQHPICPLDLMMLEGLRLRRTEIEEQKTKK